ncbi:MAG: hypothetical protein HY966_06395, partial [Ignavibacteriales bacterium]|nr:hypothetical protein [Ignavibacteriales bacterium]
MMRLVVSGLLVVLVNGFAESQRLLDHATLRLAVDAMLHQRYDRSDSLVRAFIQSYPREPIGYLTLAGLEQYRSID